MTTRSPPQLTGIGQIAITVADAGAGLGFYRDALALPFLSSAGPAERAPQRTATMPGHALWIGFLRDPDGNLVGLMEETRR